MNQRPSPHEPIFSNRIPSPNSAPTADKHAARRARFATEISEQLIAYQAAGAQHLILDSEARDAQSVTEDLERFACEIRVEA